MASLTGLIAGAVLAISFLATPATSTHEIDHRYLVVGYVQEGNGQAIPRSRVRLVREKTGLSHETMTERDGFYLLIQSSLLTHGLATAPIQPYAGMAAPATVTHGSRLRAGDVLWSA